MPPTPINAALPVRTVDHYDLDDVDASHPINIDYIVPAAATGIIKVTLSWKLRPFRSTVNVNPGTIGTDATSESGHSHSHSHSIPIDAGPFSNAAGWDGGNFKAGGGGTAPTNGNAVGSSGHSHSHTHSLSGGGNQSVSEAATVGTITNLAIDGVDRTADVGGPWPNGDVIELDITSIFARSLSAWHGIALTPSALTRVVSLLRIYYT
jgi:hypothetical protein